ncbi:A disintegrin and metalloproteinase with thrombospondin motifs adt-1 [Cephus cinctus]|uniref:A disintegrin and metalloproteinase with thrombospondin motifs adt-1 n=1 Tax=Cephus cinctus TaxID=211228 RepID=A0AAJ7BYV5_CEPCN|nr:A disintegrin and metalloproteinase with thrombospondin motifs adt-1 [Cephus cinctus]
MVMEAPACNSFRMDFHDNHIYKDCGSSACPYKMSVLTDNSIHLNLKLAELNMILKVNVLLLVILNAIRGQDINDDVEVILLPVRNSYSDTEVPLRFRVFGQTIELNLRKNDKLLAPSFKVWRHNSEDILEEAPELNRPAACHYLHRNHYSSAAISLCRRRAVHGFVFLENVTLEITPLRHADTWSFVDHTIEGRSGDLLREPHVVRRAYVTPAIKLHEDYLRRRDGLSIFKNDIPIDSELFSRPARGRRENGLTLELAVFLDEAGYNLFSPFFDRNEEKLCDMLLAYINGVQALYHHPSLGAKIDIALVRLDMMKRQPSDMPHYNGERGNLLDSFCHYTKKHNPSNDKDPNHWDMGLYVSGLDFYAMEGGRKSSVTMGLATVGGVCLDQYSCVIAELGVTNRFGKPYPSAGFTSVYIAAHEIGHNLGMHHDSTGNTCPKDGYIMSPSRGTQGETIWSQCSRDVARKLSQTKPCLLDQPPVNSEKSLDHGKFIDLPGRQWDAKKQCEFLLRDKDAVVVTLSDACQALQCKSPHRSGYYYAGPALDGTRCAERKECRGGECLPALQLPNGGQSAVIKKGGWSAWKAEGCRSGCIQKCKGAQPRRRYCDNPPPTNTEAGCEGPSYDVLLCSDEKLCKAKRKSASEFATAKCSKFSEKLPELDSKGSGLQAPHETERPWMACAIFCRRKDGGSYYTPRIELNDLGLDPYFPDGTWCHTEEGQDYFCRQHHCLPETFRFGKELIESHGDEDMKLGPQNARPDGHKLPDQLVKYLSLGPDGLPLLTTLSPGVASPPSEDDWTDKDYIELPKPVEEEDSLEMKEEPQISQPRVPKLLDLDTMFSDPL